MKRLLLIVMMAAASACGGDEPDSGPDAGGGDGQDGELCSAGCEMDGECLPGESVDACGAGGDMCQVCGDGQTCQAGVCQAPAGCGPDTCDGCCDGDVCLSGSSGAACGSGGAACTDCGARGVCAEETATCEVDPDSRWNLIANSAALPETTGGDGGTWDAAGGLPDGLVRSHLGDDTLGETGTDNDTLTPAWDEVFATDVRAADLPNVLVEILDNDIDADDVIGACTLPALSFDSFDGSAVTVTCDDRAGWELSMSLQPN